MFGARIFLIKKVKQEIVGLTEFLVIVVHLLLVTSYAYVCTDYLLYMIWVEPDRIYHRLQLLADMKMTRVEKMSSSSISTSV